MMLDVTQKAEMKKLKRNRNQLSQQQYRTIKGQILSGDVSGADRGLEKLLFRRGGSYATQTKHTM